jgi:hypothetical protein
MSAPISLYIALETGRKADLEVVARTSLAFVAAVRAIAAIHDPFAEVRIELVSAPEGSIRLNALIGWLKDKTGIEDEATLKVIVIYFTLWFGDHVGSWTVGKIMDYLTNQNAQQTISLSDTDVQRIADRVAATLEKRVAEPQVQQIYRELERDTAVSGVGSSLSHKQKPLHIVPRSEFQERGLSPELVDVPELSKRTTISDERVRLISPVLLQSERKWQFAGRTGAFSAPVLDKEFLDNLVQANVEAPLAGGIEMDIVLQVVEEFKGGVWTIAERNVLLVRRIYSPPMQHSFLPISPPR